MSHPFIEDLSSFRARIQLYCGKQKQKLLQLERHRHVDFINRKVHNAGRGRCFANKNFHVREGKFGSIYSLKIF